MSFRCIHRMVRYGGGYSAGRVWVKCVFSAVRGYLFVLFGALYSQCIPELHWSRMVANLNLIRIKSLKRWGNPIIHSRSPWLNCLVSWSLSAARRNILTCCLSNINGSIWWKADRGERRGAGQVMLFNTIDPAWVKILCLISAQWEDTPQLWTASCDLYWLFSTDKSAQYYLLLDLH